MGLNARAESTNISDRAAGDEKLADAENVSGGVEAAVGDVDSFTLYLSAGGAVDLTVEASPDGGESWYVLPESPIQFKASGDNAIHVEYNLTHVRLTGSNGTAVTAQFREVI